MNSSNQYLKTNEIIYKECLKNDSSTQIQVFNALGELVLDLPQSYRIDISDLRKGSYILKLINHNEQQTKQFVKM